MPREQIDDGQDLDLGSVEKLAVNQIHRADVIDLRAYHHGTRIEAWRRDYNEGRYDMVLGNFPRHEHALQADVSSGPTRLLPAERQHSLRTTIPKRLKAPRTNIRTGSLSRSGEPFEANAGRA